MTSNVGPAIGPHLYALGEVADDQGPVKIGLMARHPSCSGRESLQAGNWRGLEVLHREPMPYQDPGGPSASSIRTHDRAVFSAHGSGSESGHVFVGELERSMSTVLVQFAVEHLGYARRSPVVADLRRLLRAEHPKDPVDLLSGFE